MIDRLVRYTKGWTAAFWLIATGVVGGWWMFATQIVPGLIGDVHAGGGPALLRRAMSSASSRPLAGYLETWGRLTVSATFYLITLVLIGYVVLRVVHAVRAAPASGESGSTGLPPWTPVATAVWFGLLAGIGESWYSIAKVYLLAEQVPRFAPTNIELAVLAPWVNAAILGALAVPLTLIARRTGRMRVVTLAVFAVVCFLTMLGWTRLPERATLIPALIFALGVTAQATRSARPRLDRFAAYVMSAAPRGALALIVPVIAIFSARLLPDWRGDVEPAAGSPNVLLIVLDTKRARSMGMYGHDGQTTPRLDAIAARGVTFDAAYSPAAWTLPAHASMFTGRYPVEIGMMGQSPLSARYPTVAQAFEAAGYATGGFAGNLFFLSEIFRLNRGFREWRTVPLSLESLGASMWTWRSGRQKVRRRLGAHRYLVLKDAATVNNEALAWLDRLPADRPFFAFLNYFDAHEPYTAGPEPGLDGQNDQRTEFLAKDNKAANYTPERIDELREAYDRSIRYLDARVGELFDALEARGRLDNTIVVITSDHGEQFGDHGLMDHGNSLYRALTHVPLIVLLPGGGYAGARVETPVGTNQIAATLEDLAGLGRTLPGASLRPELEGTAARGNARPVFSFLKLDATAVTMGDHRYIAHQSGREELYDVAADPLELNDLSDGPEHQPLLERMRLVVRGLATE